MIYPKFLWPYRANLKLIFSPECDANDLSKLKKTYNLKQIAWCKQTHQDKIFIADKSNGFDDQCNDQADAIITSETNLPLLIRTADCLSVVIFDYQKSIIANIHAGWRGQANMIITKTIKLMMDRFNCQANDLMAITSPSLGQCCAKFSNPYQELPQHLHTFIDKNDHVNLKKAAYTELINTGILKEHVYINPICTSCHHYRWFSVRYNQTKQRNINLVWLKK